MKMNTIHHSLPTGQKNILLNSVPFEPAKCPWEM